jgi:hypothetical protein
MKMKTLIAGLMLACVVGGVSAYSLSEVKAMTKEDLAKVSPIQIRKMSRYYNNMDYKFFKYLVNDRMKDFTTQQLKAIVGACSDYVFPFVPKPQWFKNLKDEIANRGKLNANLNKAFSERNKEGKVK